MLNWLKRKRRQMGLAPKARFLADVYPEYSIGKHSYGGLTVRTYKAASTFEMGDYCSVAANVRVFLGGEHRPDWVSTYPFSVLNERHGHHTGHPASKGDVRIGNDVWLGMNATIMSGVSIGDGAVIAAHSLVVKDVPAYGIVGGNPAKFIKSRFDDATVKKLLEIAWWNWPEERIDKAMPLLLQPEISAFIQAVESGEI